MIKKDGIITLMTRLKTQSSNKQKDSTVSTGIAAPAIRMSHIYIIHEGVRCLNCEAHSQSLGVKFTGSNGNRSIQK